MTKCSRTAL